MEKAKKQTYSLYPTFIRAVEEYAKDNYMNKSEVIKHALKEFIPKEYFNKK